MGHIYTATNPEPPKIMLKFYQVGKPAAGSWGFKTPTGTCDGFFSEAEAKRAAIANQAQDREQASAGTGPIAAVLRKHFEAESAGPESTVRDTGGRQPLVELQRRFSAASLLLDQAFQRYRQDRINPDFQRPYYRALERCQMLISSIFRLMASRREERWAA